MTRIEAVHSKERIADVACLAREIWQAHYTPIIGREQVDYMLDKFQSEKAIAGQLDESYEYFLVIQNGQNTGYVAVVPDKKGPFLMLSKIYVRQSERGNGFGKQALEFVEGLCLQRGITMIWLTVNKNNTHAIAWYARMGFTNAGSIIQDIGKGFIMDDFRMEKIVGKKR